MGILLALFGLICLQIVLSIDNVIFLSIVTSKLNHDIKEKSRKIGLCLSLLMNTCLILAAGYLNSIEHELFIIGSIKFSIHSFIMLGGGLFLISKAIKEIKEKMEGGEDIKMVKTKSLNKIVYEMFMIDLIFSLDSTITAVGMSDIKWIQITATLIALICMFFFFNTIAKTTEKHPSLKMIALTFLVLIGFVLFVSGFQIEIPKGYIYSAMIFSLIVEIINIKFRKNNKHHITIEELKEENKILKHKINSLEIKIK